MTSKWIFLLLIAIARVDQTRGYCYTPWGSPGGCVNIRQCAPLLKLLKQRPLTPPVLRVLRKAQCGFEGIDPKVCCKTLNYDIDIEATTTRIETTTVESTTTPTPLVPVYHHPNRRLIDEHSCGPILEGRIYGGNVTSIYEFPWMALLGYGAGSDPIEFRCGATIISKRYVLTAAHCINELPENTKLKSVRIGDHDLGKERDCDSWENGIGYNCAVKYRDYGIERVHAHPDFTRRKLHNDIALVRLDSPADFNPRSVRPICLPLGKAAIVKSQRAVVTGWGSTELGMRSQRLLKVTLPIVDLAKCRLAYKQQTVKIWEKQICAGGTNEMDSCSGDSGGPLQTVGIYNGKPRAIVHGIVSFGPHSCGIEGFPGVYTKVAYYVQWILDTMTD